LAKRTNLSFKQVAYLTENEILEFLSGSSVNIELAKSRREHGFMMFQREGKMICIDKNIKRELEKIGFHQKEQRTEKIKGSCACKGKVRGKVVLVYTIHDILKVKKGDILVAVTTHPDYVPAMQKAAAIVTDEGGILSHAAIVARELGIPCIVGTGNATTVLDYGVEVEVDAEKGTVEII
ncbi:phosphoenolpyruvate synthase, partial [Candidatus Peregrinibacteria bacterium]|nr:phosphoenolpyruvate synthase [Candidatus Peregrinibacteria bacterium]